MKIRYGITLSGDLTGLPELPALSVAELPGNRLIEPGFALPAPLRHKDIFISNPEDRRFFGMVREVSLSVRQDFFRLCIHLPQIRPEIGIRPVELPDPYVRRVG